MDETGGQVALITGGTGGLGLACAMELARRGWSLMLQHDGPAEAAAQTAGAVAQTAAAAGAAVRVVAAQADLARGTDRERLVEKLLDEFDWLDMLVNASAGRGGSADLLELSEESFREVMDAGATATLFLTQLVANEMVRMVEAGQLENPRIVTINSISAYTTSVDHGAQCVSRAAMSMLTQLFADRLGEHGMNVYEVRVGLLSAAPGDPAFAKYDKLIDQGLTPIRRWGRAADVARAVAAIADDLLSFSTGEVINVDGGFHLRRL